MNFQEALNFYQNQRKKMLAMRYVNFLSGWDMQTEAASGSIEADSEQMSVLAEYDYELTSDERFAQAVDTLFAQKDQLDEVLRHEIEVAKKVIEQTLKIPKEQYAEFSALTSKAYAVYVQAKNENNFELFRPYLEKIVEYNRNLTQWLKTDELQGYDVLLDRFEPHYTMAQYDEFFALLREKLVPVIRKLPTESQAKDPDWATQLFYKEGQHKFCEYLRDVMCFDKTRGIMKESEHPFTSGFGTDDVRITNHYYEKCFVSSLFSAIHETGHALYEQQCDKSLNQTLSGGGASLGMHESQSRFYENMIGRSEAFWQVHYKHLQQQFPVQLRRVSLKQFVDYINTAKRSFVRTEADELTYSLHIMLRYEIEKKLIDGSLEVKDLPAYWNEKFNEYFGIVPPTDTLGVLQDVHWAGGDFGYFPTYALGSAIAAQLFHAMNADFDVFASLEEGTTAKINAWLGEHVHKYGASKYPDEILRLATGEDFNPNYYVEYLLKKYK